MSLCHAMRATLIKEMSTLFLIHFSSATHADTIADEAFVRQPWLTSFFQPALCFQTCISRVSSSLASSTPLLASRTSQTSRTILLYQERGVCVCVCVLIAVKEQLR